MSAAARGRARVFVGFAAFGVFWGSWGALVPAIQAASSASDAALGTALLMVGLGALFSMRVTGGLVDRFGGVVLPVVAALFGLTGILPALAGSPVALGAALFAVGVTSGALDVALNAAGVEEEASSGRPIMNVAHASFSAGVIVSSQVAGWLRGEGRTALEILIGVAALFAILAAGPLRSRGARHAAAPAAIAAPGRLRPSGVLLGLGALCAIAFVVENAWQSWSAVHLESSLEADAWTSSLGPTTFAFAAMTGRLGGNTLLRWMRGPALLAVGAAVAGVGSGIAAIAPSSETALVGVGLAGLGTSVCAPTLISLAGAWAGPARRAAAVSTVTTVAYVGFLVGPAAVGLVSGATSLPTALASVAGLAFVLAALAPLTARIRLVARPGESAH
jgi:MFS family permease